jgi:sigma-B regulation protein RsbQ
VMIVDRTTSRIASWPRTGTQTAVSLPPIQLRQDHRVAPVGLDPLARPLGDQRRRHDRAVLAQRRPTQAALASARTRRYHGGCSKGSAMTALTRNNVQVRGSGSQAIVFAHGFGCDQHMWRFVAPAFEEDFKTVLFDHVGAGGSDLSAYAPAKYASLSGYADDLVEICRDLGLISAVFVGHSVSAMIGALASLKAPELFESLVMVGPSPRYINDGQYVGGFTADQIDELLDFLADNHMGWSAAMAPTIMGNADRPELAAELTNSFCRTDPEIAKAFARVTFMSDNRADLHKVATRTLVLQCSEDIIAPKEVGEYVHQNLMDSTLVFMQATGHCPNLSAPEETIAAIRNFV